MSSMMKGYCFLIAMFVLVVIFSVTGQRATENQTFPQAVDNAIIATQRVIEDSRYEINSDEEMIAEFSQNLMRLINSDGKIQIDVYGVDYNKGLLDIGVTKTIMYANGKKKEFNVRRTMIVDKEKNETN